MPVPKQRTTSTSEATKVKSSDHTMPDAQEFRQHLRNLAVSAMRVVIEEVNKISPTFTLLQEECYTLAPSSQEARSHKYDIPLLRIRDRGQL